VKAAHKNLVTKPERKIQPGKPRYRQEDNIKIHVTEINVHCIHLAQDRVLW
jgi:hypothetical protein